MTAAPPFAIELEALRGKLLRRALNLTRNEDDAQDLVQVTMLKAFKAQASFVPGSNLAAWLMTILRNAFLSEKRKYKREVEWNDALDQTVADTAAHGDDVIAVTEAMDMLSVLRDESRDVLMMIVNGASYEEAAAKLGLTEGTVKSRVSRARALLRGKMGMDAPESQTKPQVVSQRRFESLPSASPERVSELADDHPAILQKLPLFETTMVAAKDSPRVLVSGDNSRKIGRVVTKGAWKGFPIFTVTLAERLTCPSSCLMWKSCYGNAMPFARRHRPGEDLEQKIAAEVKDLADKHPSGFVVRLHVLGDFYSVAYAQMWASLLSRFPALHVYGYTALGTSSEPGEVAIATEIEGLNDSFPDQCMIRWSSDESGPGNAIVINRAPESSNVAEGLVCPAEREATACCATCGLCWEKSARNKTIVFVKHGLGSRSSDQLAEAATKTDARNFRPIAPIAKLAKLATVIVNEPPTMLWAKPEELLVDETYQRSLSTRSIRLITKIVSNWNWSHFKCPIAVKDEALNQFFIIDGQHTAIAAATHPEIAKIPIMVVDADSLIARAKGFISHNRDRIAVTPLQLHHSLIVAGDAAAMEVDAVCKAAGVKVLRTPPGNGRFGVGDTMALGSVQATIRKYGAERTRMVLSCLVAAERAPVRADELKAIAMVLSESSSEVQPESIVAMLTRLAYEDAVHAARDLAATSGLSRTEALASVFARALQDLPVPVLEEAAE